MYLMGLDVGTTGCKAVIFNLEGRIVSSAYREYNLYHRRIEWSELNPDEVWNAIRETIRASIKNGKVNPRRIEALSTSVLGEAFIPIDRNGNWLYWSMTTFDARAKEQTRWLEENLGADEIYRITGQPLMSSMPIYTLPKIKWLRENEPEIYKRTYMFLCWEDYINLKLCGRPVIDYSLATRTMMFDIKRKRWAEDILEAAGIDENLLPEVHPSGEVIGELNGEAADETGLAEGTLIITGGHDQPCGALGAGITGSGPLMDATGTVECVATVQNNLIMDRKMRTQGFAIHCYVIKDRYFMFGFNPSGGVILRWFRDNFADKERREAEKLGVDVYDILTEEASGASQGSLGLFLLPYFEGCGTPTFNRKMKGTFIGFTLAHGRREVIRAILEGLTYELRRNIEAIREYGIEVSEIRAIGGGAKSDFWLKLKADITKTRVVAPDVTEAAALGAAALAAIGIGAYKDAEEAVNRIYRERKVYMPDEEAGRTYDEYYNTYKRIHERIKGIFNDSNF